MEEIDLHTLRTMSIREFSEVMFKLGDNFGIIAVTRYGKVIFVVESV